LFPVSIEIDDKFTRINAEPSINWTFRGIEMDWSNDSQNGFDSIRVNREFDSNEIDESDSQFKNNLIQEFQHSLESKLIEVMILKMLQIQFVSSVNLIQMKLMKVIHNWKNI
jgi:hypothetical protein